MVQRRIQIGDLDGCIADDRWRRNLIPELPILRGPDWPDKFHGYHSNCFHDVAANLDQFIPGVDIVILTGRPVRYRAQTMAWLVEVAGIEPLHVIFRNNHDTRRSVEVKRQQLQWLTNIYGIERSQIVQAMDDMTPIVEMYASEGLNAKLVRIGEEEHVNG